MSVHSPSRPTGSHAPRRGTASRRRRAGKPVVIHVLEAFAGGTERHLLDLVRHVDGVQHVLAVPSTHHGKSTAAAMAQAERDGAVVEPIEFGRSRAPQDHALALCALRRLVRRIDPAIVHGHSSIGGVMARLATVGTSTPVVYTPHGFGRSRLAVTAERMLRGRADRVIAVSGSERDFALAHKLTRDEQVVVIPNGIELLPPVAPRDALRARLGLTGGAPLVGCVGRLTWQKAPEVFVAACGIVNRRIPSAHFVLIGSGPHLPHVERAVRAEQIEERFHIIPHSPTPPQRSASSTSTFSLPASRAGRIPHWRRCGPER